MKRLFALALLACLGCAQPAQALGCLLGCSCSVTAADIEFADLSPLSVVSASADGEIRIECAGVLSVGAGVIVELDDGLWGSYAARRMRSAQGDLADYNIYKPNQPSVVWGDGSGGSQTLQVSGGLIVLGSWSATRAVPARMTLSTATKPGDYSDTVVVRVVW